jgi:hypothetical protein
MKVDSHYYCIGVLASKAGFSKKDSLLIAYASAYVDFEIRKKAIEIGVGNHDFPEEKLMPIVTQKVSLSSFDKTEQMLVYFPFHFMPSKTFLSYSETDFKARPFHENDTTQNLFERLLDSFKDDPDLEYSLIKLGIVMHCIADTYSHQRFSGRHHEENKVTDLKVSYDYGEEYEEFDFTIAPQIGHAETESIADNPVCYWKSKERGIVKNPDDFKRAFKTIYDLMIQAKNKIEHIYKPSDYKVPGCFNGFETLLFNVVFCKNNPKAINDEDEKIKLWVETFEGIFKTTDITHYFKANDWWNDVLALDESNKQDPAYHRNGYEEDLRKRRLKYFKMIKIKETNWYKFTEAAKEIRKITLKYLCQAKMEKCNSAKDITNILNKMINARSQQELEDHSPSDDDKLQSQTVETGSIDEGRSEVTDINWANPLENKEMKKIIKDLKGKKQVKHWISVVRIIDDLKSTKDIKNFYQLIEKGNDDQLKLFSDFVNLINIMEFMKDGETPNAEIYHDINALDSENDKYLKELASLDDEDDLDMANLDEEEYVTV